MGTNYYWCEECITKCNACGHELKLGVVEKHIGKLSGGWTFALRIYPDEGIYTLAHWINIWCIKKGWIRDDCNNSISIVGMLGYIMCRNGGSFEPSEEWYRQNHARSGPKGLAQRIGKDTIGYGENGGT